MTTRLSDRFGNGWLEGRQDYNGVPKALQQARF